ncbi:NADH-quinone oxidoreductase subunit N [bacterium]|nr:MAG: NADH-quinone oxidoreductase subunit N [bacterium]
MLSDLNAFLPVLTLVVTALAIMVADWFLPEGDPRPPATLAVVGLSATGAVLARGWLVADTPAFVHAVARPGPGPAEAAMVWHDGFGVFAGAVLVVAALLTVLLGLDHARRRPALARAEHVVLVLLATAAMLLVAMANDLILVFLGIETFSIALYVLAGFLREERPSLEAAMKYFVLGAFAAGFLLYGIALVYASTGTTNLEVVAAILAAEVHSLPRVAYVGLGLILVGLGFKVAAVPFHQWTPDVYEGAPTTVTAFMSAATKTAAFAALMRVLWVGFAPLADAWVPLVTGAAVLTMVVGNLSALVQVDLKRMLGFSAVAHAGYLLVAVAAGPALGASALLFYLLVYALMNLGAFGALLAIGPVGPEGRDATNLRDLRGLWTRSPGVALALAVCLIGLTGLPPTAGFMGKWYIFMAAVDADLTWLAAVMVLASVVSAFYYLRPVALMFVAPPEDPAVVAPRRATAVAVGVAAALVALAMVVLGPVATAATGASMAGASPDGLHGARAGEPGSGALSGAP